MRTIILLFICIMLLNAWDCQAAQETNAAGRAATFTLRSLRNPWPPGLDLCSATEIADGNTSFAAIKPKDYVEIMRLADQVHEYVQSRRVWVDRRLIKGNLPLVKRETMSQRKEAMYRKIQDDGGEIFVLGDSPTSPSKYRQYTRNYLEWEEPDCVQFPHLMVEWEEGEVSPQSVFFSKAGPNQEKRYINMEFSNNIIKTYQVFDENGDFIDRYLKWNYKSGDLKRAVIRKFPAKFIIYPPKKKAKP